MRAYKEESCDSPISFDEVRLAERYLRFLGKDDLIHSEQSTDGYTLVALANAVYKKGKNRQNA